MSRSRMLLEDAADLAAAVDVELPVVAAALEVLAEDGTDAALEHVSQNLDGEDTFAVLRAVVEGAVAEIADMRATVGNPFVDLSRPHVKMVFREGIARTYADAIMEDIARQGDVAGPLLPYVEALNRFEHAHLLTAALRSKGWVEPLPAGVPTAMFGRPDLAYQHVSRMPSARSALLPLLDPVSDQWLPGLWNPSEAVDFETQLRDSGIPRNGGMLKMSPGYRPGTPLHKQRVLA